MVVETRKNPQAEGEITCAADLGKETITIKKKTTSGVLEKCYAILV